MFNTYPHHEAVRDFNLLLTRSRRRYGLTRLPVYKSSNGPPIAIAYVYEFKNNIDFIEAYGIDLHQLEPTYWYLTIEDVLNLHIQAKRLFNLTDEQFNAIYPQERTPA